jgi:hypothetical protein
MENEDEDDIQKSDKDKKEKIRSYLEQMVEGKKQPVAKDLVHLEHVETKKQEVSQDALDLAQTLKEQLIEHDGFERLSNDELTILESFMGKRLFLSRIAIITNQSRIPLGIEPFKKADLEKILNSLITKGYVAADKVGNETVYFLTERGRYRVQ